MNRQWSEQTRYYVLTVMIFLGGLLLYTLRELIGPLVVAAMLAYMLHPVVVVLQDRTPINRKFGVLLVFTVFLALLSVIPAVFTPAVIREVDTMDLQVERIVQGINDFFSQTTVFGYRIFEGVPQGIDESISQVLHPEQVFDSVQAITENVVWLFMIFISVYYLLLDWKKIRSVVYHIFPKSEQADAIRLYRKLSHIWGRYLRGQLLAMFLIGLLSGVGSAILNLPGAIVIGFVAAAFAVVPSVGSSAMVVVVGLVAFFSQTPDFMLNKFWYLFAVMATFTGLHLFDNYYLRPRILGQGLKIHPAFVLIGVIGALSVGGPILALVIVPVISTVEIILKYVFARMTGRNPWVGMEAEFADLRGDA